MALCNETHVPRATTTPHHLLESLSTTPWNHKPPSNHHISIPPSPSKEPS
ncbi:hypothetical protein SESBI_21259 [Sesbania bispinosa]|nr:hypothetical protein SESBI_21259 [Sesbania bispinosa]